MKIAITGHRPNKLGNDYDLTSPLVLAIKAKLQEILTHDYLYYYDVRLISGMALGINTLFAQIAVAQGYPFIAAISCIQQHAKWTQKSKEIYLDLINHTMCDKHYVSTEPYNNSCMQKRNIYMVDNCDILIAVWDGTSGGTVNCVAYARQVGKQIIIINPNDFRH